MTAPQNVIAVIFDFDDTLTDDSTTRAIVLTRWGATNPSQAFFGDPFF